MKLEDLSTVTLADIQQAQELIKLAKRAISEFNDYEPVSDPPETFEFVDRREDTINVDRSDLAGVRWDNDGELCVVTIETSYYLTKANGTKFLRELGFNLPYPY